LKPKTQAAVLLEFRNVSAGYGRLQQRQIEFRSIPREFAKLADASALARD
jgi:hypothetical protein